MGSYAADTGSPQSAVSRIRSGKRLREIPHYLFPHRYLFTVCHMDLSGTGTETGGGHVYILPETAGRRQPVPAGVTVEKSRKPFVFCLFQNSGTRMSLKGAPDPGTANGHRSVRYECFPRRKPGSSCFSELECLQGPSAFSRRSGNIQLSAS